MGINQITERFNKELFWQIEGKLPKGHIYKLGMPSQALLASGVDNLPIELSSNILRIKSKDEYVNSHPFALVEVPNLPMAIAHPIAVFDSKTRKDSKVILTELQSRGVNFVVAMQLNKFQKQKNNHSLVINDVRSIYPKDYVKDIYTWIKEDLLRWVAKEKVLAFITNTSTPGEVAKSKDFILFTKILQNFENPKYSPTNNLPSKLKL